MKRILTIVVALATLAPFSAHADNARMTDGRYVAATRCLAYADLPELQSDQANFSGLRAAAAVGYHDASIVSAARDNTIRVRATARRLASMNNGLQQLRDERDAACSSFVSGGLVQIQTTSAPS